jgi:hypothetical protein
LISTSDALLKSLISALSCRFCRQLWEYSPEKAAPFSVHVEKLHLGEIETSVLKIGHIERANVVFAETICGHFT